MLVVCVLVCDVQGDGRAMRTAITMPELVGIVLVVGRRLSVAKCFELFRFFSVLVSSENPHQMR